MDSCRIKSEGAQSNQCSCVAPGKTDFVFSNEKLLPAGFSRRSMPNTPAVSLLAMISSEDAMGVPQVEQRKTSGWPRNSVRARVIISRFGKKESRWNVKLRTRAAHH